MYDVKFSVRFLVYAVCLLLLINSKSNRNSEKFTRFYSQYFESLVASSYINQLFLLSN